ncbi:hypothetical protein RPMA_12460 [Tardiphaga alba]|uniref:Uncharacterized protein n=1 Tax=Tardiphaga alba TaxID=340268 RepID=A0ABX8AAW0_9BRAD|nr:hypothetical protein [Tardiphaga alba]QUS39558.1 hypothetical protein RPMA_12460 [Tardiphaga alba]
MAVRTRIDSVATDINLIISDLLTPEAQGKAAAAFARDAIAEADATNQRILGRIPPRTVTVDGVANAPLERVRPAGGSIIAEWEIVGDVLIWIARTLEDRSPRVKGDYLRGHTLFADGVEVAVSQNVPVAEEYTFVNVVPYSRILEVGKTDTGRDFLIQVPNRIYERTGRDAKALFKNVKIQSRFISLNDAYRLKFNQRSRHFKGGKAIYSSRQRPDRVAGAAITYPAIVVSQLNR